MRCGTHRDTFDDESENLGGMPDEVANEFGGSEEPGAEFEPLSSIVDRLVGRLRIDEG